MTTKHPTASRVHRSDPEPDDAFIARILEFSAWARTHSRRILIGGAVAVVLVLAALYWVNYRSTLRSQATARLTEIRQTAAAGNAAVAIRDLEAYLEQFGSTPSADEARIVLAGLYLSQGQPARVPEVLASLARDLDRPLGPSAAFLVAAAEETAGNTEQAEATYLRIADRARLNLYQREALEDAARLRLDADDGAGAAELYQRLLDLTPDDSPMRGVYLLRQAEASARAKPAG